MTDEQFWRLEESLWTGGLDQFAAALDPARLMVFPGMGALGAAAALEGLRQAPRWRSVEMSERRLARPADGIVTLAYRAHGEREGAASCDAWCGSSYRCAGESWLLFQHQQTPV